jgi:hypothetical protein
MQADAQMANEKEVKAQVRLRFWNVNRQRMTATRNLQVTVKKGGGLTMKTLEGILAKTDADGGEGKVSLCQLFVLLELTNRGTQYQPNVLRWMKKCLFSSEYLGLSWRMSFSVIRRNRIGRYRNLLL